MTSEVIAFGQRILKMRPSQPKEIVMTFVLSRYLRFVLLADAAASGATALLLLAGAGVLENWLGLPVALMREAGLVLVPYVIFVAVIASRRTASTGTVGAVIAINALWTAGSLLLPVSGWVAPTALGVAFVIAQGLVVGLLGLLQYAGLRQPGHSAA
jgi:hypothetical protein